MKIVAVPWLDAGGVAHDPARAGSYRRIVSLVPSLTESLCAVGGRERLAGITAFCIRPPGLLRDRRVVKIGGTKKFSREKLLALAPDLVLVNLEENELEDIAFLKARVECYVNGVKTVEEGLATLRELGALLGPEDAGAALERQGRALLAAVRAGVRAHRTRMARSAPRPRIFYPVWRDPWIGVGPDTFIADHFRTLGAEPVPRLRGPSRYPALTLERAARSRPDRVWLPSEPYHFTARDAAEVRATPGFAETRIELVDGDNLCWFGARQLEGLAYGYKLLWGTDPE